MKKIVLSFAFYLGFVATSFAQPSPSPYSKPITDKVDAIFTKWATPKSPSCALAVIKDEQIIYKSGYGMADLEHKVPISPSTVFSIASTSKQFTAASIVLLAQQGKISLDDDIRKYVPEIPDFGTPITIRQLVHHTSGLRDILYLWFMAGRRKGELHSLDEMLAFLARQKELSFKPNDQHSYSNTGYYLMAIIVKRASGLSLRELAEQIIFKPLGMTHTSFSDGPNRLPENNAFGYSASANKFRRDMDNLNLVGANGLWTSAEDLLLWDRNFYSGKLGGTAFLEQMHTQGVLNSGEKIGYAFGLTIGEYRGLKTVRHSGGGGGWRTDFLRFPEQKFSVVCLCNVDTVVPWDLTQKVADLYLADQFIQPATARNSEIAAVRLSNQELASRAGVYWNAEKEHSLRLYFKEGKLKGAFVVGDLELLPLDKNRFRIADYPDQVIFDAPEANKPQRLKTINEDNEIVNYVALPPLVLTKEQLTEYIGTYSSEELDASWNVDVKKDHLTLRLKTWGTASLTPLFSDTFAMEAFGEIKFIRNSQHKVTGLKLSNPRAKNIQFIKTK